MREEHERAASYRECSCTGSASGTPVKIKAIIPLCSQFGAEVAWVSQPLIRHLESRYPSSYPIRISSLTTSGFLIVVLPPQIATETEKRFLHALRKIEKKRETKSLTLFVQESKYREISTGQSLKFTSQVGRAYAFYLQATDLPHTGTTGFNPPSIIDYSRNLFTASLSDALCGNIRSLSIAHRTKACRGELLGMNRKAAIHTARDSFRRSSRVASEFAGLTDATANVTLRGGEPMNHHQSRRDERTDERRCQIPGERGRKSRWGAK